MIYFIPPDMIAMPGGICYDKESKNLYENKNNISAKTQSNKKRERGFMQSEIQLRNTLKSIHKKSYPAYKSLRGTYDFKKYILSIDHVQGDPFAAPSNVSVFIPLKASGFPAAFLEKPHTKRALEDALLRKFERELQACSFKVGGSGKSGTLRTSRPGQEVLERSALAIDKKGLTARFEVGFPANGRTIQATALEKILFDLLPPVIEKSFYYRNWKAEILQKVFELTENQHSIRNQMKENGLVAFVADGSILPRASGVSDRPMRDAVPFVSPESCRVTMKVPYGKAISGMGIREGVTLIIGGGYHGKSTLLQALEMGVYDHIAGDGREYVLTEDTACKLRAEDGRSVQNLDLSLFIHDLPNGKDPQNFSTADASGSTSQAAAVIEGIEAGCHTFLIDEDTSATNFLVRDAFMQQVVHGRKEPITPFIARVRDLYEQAGISTILAVGSSGAFFHVADIVIQMDAYRPLDVKERVEKLLPQYPVPEYEAEPFALPGTKRSFWLAGKGEKGKKSSGLRERIKTKVMGTDGFSINHETTDLRYLEQIADSEQMEALAAILKYILRSQLGTKPVTELVGQIWKMLETKGLAALYEGSTYCGSAMPRKVEIYRMIDRVRKHG